jgi:hypothetical protein
LKTVTGSYTVPDGWIQERGINGTPILGWYISWVPLPSGDPCVLETTSYWTGLTKGLKVSVANGKLKIPAPNALSGFKPITSSLTSGTTSIYLGAFHNVKPRDPRLEWSDSFAVLRSGVFAPKIKNAPTVIFNIGLTVSMSESAMAKPGQKDACRAVASTTGLYTVRDMLAGFKLS